MFSLVRVHTVAQSLLLRWQREGTENKEKAGQRERTKTTKPRLSSRLYRLKMVPGAGLEPAQLFTGGF